MGWTVLPPPPSLLLVLVLSLVLLLMGLCPASVVLLLWGPWGPKVAHGVLQWGLIGTTSGWMAYHGKLVPPLGGEGRWPSSERGGGPPLEGPKGSPSGSLCPRRAIGAHQGHLGSGDPPWDEGVVVLVVRHQ